MSLTPGTQLHGYEIRRQLGAGGMGVVYLAHDLKLGRNVAIKVLSGEFPRDPHRGRRFEQEARAASSLSHPNVCVVHALGETDEGEPFIAMEYIEGVTLRHVLSATPPRLRDLLDIAIQIAAGVGAAHALGIVHRDLKPENVLVRQDGLVKVLDFGLAKIAAAGLPAGATGVTHTMVRTDAGVVMGTYTYMAPEQARGQEVDARADVWALGVMLYEMAARHVPFSGETRSDVLAAILEREPPPLDRVDSQIPHELQRIVAKALRKDRAQRYQTVTDLRLDLEVLRSELQVSSTAVSEAPVTPPTQVPTPAPTRRESSAEFLLTGLGRHKIATATLLLTVVAIGVLGAWWIRQGTIPRAGPVETSHVRRNLTRLTFGEGLQTDPTFSADGRFIAYASDRAGNFDIWVQPVAGGDPVQVTKSPAQDTQPAWSPDGNTIVFRSERDGGGLYLVPVLGGQERQLASYGQHPKWTPDGSEVLFLVGASLDSGEDLARLYSVAREGGTPRELAAPFLGSGTWRWVARHPDGRISALGTHAKLGVGFFTSTEDGSRVVESRLPADVSVKAAGYDRIRFQWDPSGTRIYIEAPVSGLQNLWRAEVDPATLDWRSVERLTTDAASDVGVALSPDGSRLTFAQRNMTTRLWAFPLDATTGRLGAKTNGQAGVGRPITDPGGTVGSSGLSPDGSAVAYSMTRPGVGRLDLWVTHIDSGRTELLTQAGYSPAWSADGKRIAYARFQKNTSAAFVRDVGAPDETQISPWSSDRALLPNSWTPDGRAIVMAVTYTNNSPTPLWLWPAAGGDKPTGVLLGDSGTNFWEGNLSPNGRWLAFAPRSIGDPGIGRVAIAPAGGAPPSRWTLIAPDFPWVDKPRWAPDGRTLYFLARGRDGFFNLFGVPFDSERGTPNGKPFALTHYDSPSLTISPYVGQSEWGIAAHSVVLTMLSSTGSIWMLDGIDR